ncbi:hypothetical protein K8Z61_18620 [Nocardioides sp. TRM66260-LWL]|uniref:hypothetical protein n=1 Tax=Nocardioides sp. TRM66260-LWL TaxID=2874478 RepID=UPI001CC81156|nr:hypothetical protein [Nocardioides sp. TRM66260-LWL]MBZ5736510.1 hypothetical protein [Nocardioides sp. TRM66260-LWL]
MTDPTATFVIALLSSPVIVLVAKRFLSRGAPPTVAEMVERIAALEARVERVERESRLKDDYIGVLRAYITEGKPPPPPAWPAGLTS